MMKNYYVILLILCAVSINVLAQAQDVNNKNLTTILNILSRDRNVKFSFSPSLTNNVYPKNVDLEGSIDEILGRVLKGTGFAFRLIKNQYYYIFKDSNKVRPVSITKRQSGEPVAIQKDTIIYHNITIDIDDITPYKRYFCTNTSKSGSKPYYRSELRLPVCAIKSNLLYDATATINLGIEYGLSHCTSLDLSANFNSWTYSDNRKMKHWFVQPEYRLWNCERFNGGFFGAHVFAGTFNWGGMLPWGFKSGKMFGTIENSAIINHRFDGYVIGGGISYGYHWILGKRWGLEAEIGAGYAYLKYTKYRCEKCGDKIGKDEAHYFGPTKAAISLVYLLK